MGEAAKKWMAAVEDPSKLVAENKKLRDAIHRAGFQVLQTSGDWSIHDVSELAKSDEARTNQVIAENIDLRIEIESLKNQLAAAPHWVPVAEWAEDFGWHYVAASNGLCFDARLKGGKWFPAYAEGSLDVDVTHVLVGLNPPADNEDPLAEQDALNDTDDSELRLSAEQLQEMNRMLANGECKPKGPLVLIPDDASAIECAIKTNRDVCLESGRVDFSPMMPQDATRARLLQPFNGRDARSLGACEYKLRDGEYWQWDNCGNWQATDTPMWSDSQYYRLMATACKSDLSEVCSHRLLQPFLGSEAKKLGATKYQLRDGEQWLTTYGSAWVTCKNPAWFDDSKYRLATGEKHDDATD